MKTAITIRHTHVTGILKVMLVLLISFFYCNNINAQSSFTPVDYDLPDVPSRNSNGYTNYQPNTTLNSNTHNKQNINFICSESNGYGTWAADDGGHWYLLGNALKEEDPSNSNGPVPSGIVASGSFPPSPTGAPQPYSFSNHVKVATNSRGNVRYVWWKPTGNGATTFKFIVQGFNPVTEIDINMPTGYPNSASSLEVIKGIEDPSMNSYKIHDYGTYIPFPTGAFSTMPPGGPSGEVDNHWKDDFDVAFDEKYLYITWQLPEYKYTVVTNGISKDIFEYHIFAVVLNLSDNTPVSGFNWPIQVNSIGTHGVRPTVACDRRSNNPDDQNTDAPDFDLAYISCANGITPLGGNSFVIHVHITNQALINNQWARTGMNRSFLVDAIGSIPLPAYSNPRRTRMMVPSVSGQTSPCKAIYTLVDPVGPHLEYANDLLLHKFSASTNTNPPADEGGVTAKIADGNQFNAAGAHTTSLFTPENSNVPYSIINLPIVGFANPYDGKGDLSFNEFHCIYQVHKASLTNNNDPISPSPLMIIRGTDNGKVEDANNLNVSADTRTLLSREKTGSAWTSLEAPFIDFNSQFFWPNYTASVNQMGIHVYWHGVAGSPVFYSRDKRIFDEDIEENTLVTYDCIVDDGTAHGGTTGATLIGGKTMTLWTDPNFNGGALYARNPITPDSWNNTQLWFGAIAENVKLHIGKPTYTAGDPIATLNIPPNFEAHFEISANGTIQVNPTSILNYYGIPNNWGTGIPLPPSTRSNFFGTGTIKIVGADEHMVNDEGKGNHPDYITKAGILNIRGGAELQISNGVTLDCDKARLNHIYESSILPLTGNPNPNSANAKTCGFIDIYGTGIFNASIITNTGAGNLANKVLRGIVCKRLILPEVVIYNPYANYPVTQLSITNCAVTGANNLRYEVACNGNVSISSAMYTETTPSHTLPLDDGNERIFSVEGSLFNHSTFYVADPWNASYQSPFGVGGTNTISVINAAFANSGPFGLYLYRNNTSDYHNIVIDNCSFGSAGSSALIEGFDADLEWTWVDDALYQHVVNRINLINSSFSDGTVGVHSINSNIAVGNNTISGSGTGILQTQAPNYQPVKSTSFFCNNTISGGSVGMQLDNWQGYVKLSSISASEIGVKCLDNLNGFFTYSSIKNCSAQGLLLNPFSASNLSKLSAQGTYNTFELNNSGNASNSQIEIDDGGRLRIRSHNNIVRHSGLSPNDNFLFHPGTVSLPIGYGTGDDDIDGNYWADNGNNTTSAPFTKSSDVVRDANIVSVSFTNGASDANKNSYYTTSSVYCSSGISEAIIYDKLDKILALQEDKSKEDCYNILNEGDALRASKSYQAAYDKYRSFFDTCAYLSNAWEFFSEVGSMNASRSGDYHRFEEYREWLKKVLYYNLDTNYYCADAFEILSTFRWFNDQRGNDWRGMLAVDSFLLKSGKCPKSAHYLDSLVIPGNWHGLYQAWVDSVKDPSLTPFDSTLPSLEDLDLGILRGQPKDVKKYFDSKYGEILSNIIATVNPFSSETKIDFRCREASAIHFEVYDILGRKVYDGGRKVYDEGENRITLPGKDLPHGELFGRFSASDGTIKTIKLGNYILSEP